MKKIEITEQTTREDLVAALTDAYAEADKLEESILQTEEDLTEATATIKDLKEKLDAKSKETSTKLPVVTVDGQKFEVTIPKFSFEGKDYAADDLKTDADLCKKLVAIGFGGLREIRDRKKS